MLRMKSPWIIFVAVVSVIIASSVAPAQADGVDIVPYLTRVGWAQSTLGIIASVLGLMVINYVLNLVVIGWPAIHFGHIDIGRVTRGLVALTLLGQVADRLGALLASPITVLTLVVTHHTEGEGVWFLPLLAFNFVLSGIAILMLVLYFLRRRWHVARGLSWSIGLAAAVLTNPAWAIASWWFV